MKLVRAWRVLVFAGLLACQFAGASNPVTGNGFGFAVVTPYPKPPTDAANRGIGLLPNVLLPSSRLAHSVRHLNSSPIAAPASTSHPEFMR